MPPEVYGCLSVAENHARALKDLKWKFYGRGQFRYQKARQKHEAKIQRLISKAVKYLNNRKETL